MKRYSQEELAEFVEQNYGFKKESVKNAQVVGLWFVNFEVNGILYQGAVPFHGALPRLYVCGYTAKHYYKGGPITEEYYNDFIRGRKFRLIRYLEEDWEWLNLEFDTEEEANKYIETLDNPQTYGCDIYIDNEPYPTKF